MFLCGARYGAAAAELASEVLFDREFVHTGHHADEVELHGDILLVGGAEGIHLGTVVDRHVVGAFARGVDRDGGTGHRRVGDGDLETQRLLRSGVVRIAAGAKKQKRRGRKHKPPAKRELYIHRAKG